MRDSRGDGVQEVGSRYLTLASDQTRHVTIPASYLSRPLTKPGYCPQIGTDWFRDLNTSLWLLLAKTDHLTQILTCDWPTTSLILNSHFRRNSRHRRKPSLWRAKVVTKRQLYSCCPAGRLGRTDSLRQLRPLTKWPSSRRKVFLPASTIDR